LLSNVFPFFAAGTASSRSLETRNICGRVNGLVGSSAAVPFLRACRHRVISSVVLTARGGVWVIPPTVSALSVTNIHDIVAYPINNDSVVTEDLRVHQHHGPNNVHQTSNQNDNPKQDLKDRCFISEHCKNLSCFPARWPLFDSFQNNLVNILSTSLGSLV
jgi:hypothetical protein